MKFCWYTVVTLRDSCIEGFIDSFRKYYPNVDLCIVDNCADHLSIFDYLTKTDKLDDKIRFYKNDKIDHLTVLQNKISKELFEEYDILGFSSDDIRFQEGGFLEKACGLLYNGGHEFVSLTTPRDACAYIYSKTFWEGFKFNENLKGKECTDNDLTIRIDPMKHIGEYWRPGDDGWTSRYVLNPYVHKLGKDDVNDSLEKLGIDSGRNSNKHFIGKVGIGNKHFIGKVDIGRPVCEAMKNKIENVAIGTMTMDAGDGVFNSPIKDFITNLYDGKVRKLVIFDGNLTDSAREFYQPFLDKNPEWVVVDYPWDDQYHTRYQRFANEFLIDGEWGLWLDDDECPSFDPLYDEAGKRRSSLFGTLAEFNPQDKDVQKLKLCQIPCQTYILEDGEYYCLDPYPVDPRKFTRETWLKNVLFKKTSHLYFRWVGSHVIPLLDDMDKHFIGVLQQPYYHLKSFESFVYNDVFQAFLNPQAQHFTPEESKLFQLYTKQFKTMADFKKATKSSGWPKPLQKFAWSKRNEVYRPVSRLAWVYFILEGNKLLFGQDPQMKWDIVKQYVFQKEKYDLFAKNKEERNFLKWT